LGLFCAVELVKDRATKKPFNTMREKYEGKPLTVDLITKELMKQNVYVQGWVSHLILAPPLIITDEEIDLAVTALDGALKTTDGLTEMA
jgi:taurine--2-oxoglutarate transaminase